MRKNAGFTLIELMVACVIIAILISVAIPSYRDMHERAKASKALATLDSIRTAESIFRDRDVNQTFTNNLATLRGVNPFPTNAEDGDWAYTIPSVTARTYTIRATRTGGAHNGSRIEMNETGDVSVNGDTDQTWPP